MRRSPRVRRSGANDPMNDIQRFVRRYVRPLMPRVILAVSLAGILSSYFFLLGFITKMTVDHVLQIRPGSVAAERSDFRGRGGDGFERRDVDAGLRDPARRLRDPRAARPGLQPPLGPLKSRGEKIRWLWIVFFCYLGVRLVFSLTNWLYLYTLSFIGQRIVYRVRLDLHKKIQKLQMTYFDRQQTGKLMSRVLDDIGLLQTEVTTTVVQTVRHVGRILIGVVVLLAIHAKLALLALIVLPIYVLTFKLFQKGLSSTAVRWREAYADAYGLLEERIRGIQVVLSFVRERSELRQFFKKVARVFRLSVRRFMLNSGLRAACMTVSAVATALVFYWGALLVRSGEMTLGELIYFNVSLGILFQPLVQLSEVSAVFQEMAVVISRVFEVLDERITIEDRPDAADLKQIRGRVVFRKVGFQYREGSEPVLKDLSFEAKPGSAVAVVGPSGSGKSTLLSLLLRLYEPTEGSILVDDYEIQDIKLSSLRKHIALVPQEPILFSGSIAENISFGRRDAAPEEIMKAAKAAELHDFIMSLPEKYEARVEEQGINLSGGQKQRLAFAMALLSNPSILILDDTTSALDAETEARIRATLERIMRNRTTFIITHRISTAMRADRILVLDKGRMVGWGRHSDLISGVGLYRQMAEQQRKGEAGRGPGPDAGLEPLGTVS